MDIITGTLDTMVKNGDTNAIRKAVFFTWLVLFSIGFCAAYELTKAGILPV